MEAKVTKLENNKVSLEVEVGTDQVDKALEQAYRKVVKKLHIPGFRKGRVPRHVLEQRFGKEVLYEDALEILLPEAYSQAVEETNLDPIDQPQVEDVHIEAGSPFRFTATVEVKPEVQLGDYKGLPVQMEAVSVSDEDVEDYLKNLQERTATWQVAEDKEAADGDMVMIDFEGFAGGEPIEGGKGENHPLVLGSGSFIPGFEEQLVGIKAGEERKIKVTFPEEYHNADLSGQEAEFVVTATEVKFKELAPLDDEFAKDVGEHETLAELKEKTKERLEQSATANAEADFHEKLIKMATDNAQVDIPEVMIKRRVKSMVEDLEQRLKQQGIPLDAYLQYSEKTIEELEEEFAPMAQESVKSDLVLDAIAEAENVTATPEDLDAQLEKMVAGYGKDDDERQKMKENLKAHGQLDVFSHGIVREKTINLLVENATAAEN